MKSLGILTEMEDLSSIELEAFTIVEIEGTKAERLNSEKKAEREKTKMPTKRNKNGR